jgi:hypothetical protein
LNHSIENPIDNWRYQSGLNVSSFKRRKNRQDAFSKAILRHSVSQNQAIISIRNKSSGQSLSIFAREVLAPAFLK